MVNIEKDRWGTEYFAVNGKWINRVDHYSFNFFLDKESGNIYSEDTERSFTLEEISEFVNYIKNIADRKNKREF